MVSSMGEHFPTTGRVQWMGLAAEKRATITSVQQMELCTETGIIGDHHLGGRKKERQVTLVQAEHLTVVANLLQHAELQPGELRRNIVVSGINLLALRNRRFRIGTALLQGTGHCHPCSRMEENLGPGGYNAMRGHGGITAQVIAPGHIELNDDVVLVGDEPYSVEFEE